jgi:hypothetical protein
MPWTQEYRYKIMLTQLKGETQDLWECHGQDISQYYVSLKSSNIVEANIPMKSWSPILERWSAEAALAEKWPDVAVNQHTNQTIKCNLNMALPSCKPIESYRREYLKKLYAWSSNNNAIPWSSSIGLCLKTDQFGSYCKLNQADKKALEHFSISLKWGDHLPIRSKFKLLALPFLLLNLSKKNNATYYCVKKFLRVCWTWMLWVAK